MPADKATPADNETAADQATPADRSGATEPDADLKAQFLQALARKKGQRADGVSGSGPDSSKIHDVHGKVGGKRQFRRKSGG
ncbi:MAG TPA: DUF5302 domain-containing protein [Jatrophihabitans sp.]|nr:DUF5302 domain-containing protein [Jatrophihabitans sp.]